MSEKNWVLKFERTDGPIYLSIADAIEKDIQSGTLKAGQALPPQRVLAHLLGIDFTTVSRAYTEARKRGLIEAITGRGTFVAQQPLERERSESLNFDMAMNVPPHFDNPSLQKRIETSMTDFVRNQSQDLLLEYQLQGGFIRDREMGAKWLHQKLPHATVEQILICPGAQAALSITLQTLSKKNDFVCCEALTYPGFLSLAAHMELSLLALEMDDEGIIPAAFETACQNHKPKALYCTPTLHNPTTLTWSQQRRQTIVDIARKYNVPIIEDDAYGILSLEPVSSLAALAPELVYYIASTSKALGPALRIAYLHAPNRMAFRLLINALRATSTMASPLMSSLVSYWIDSGIANEITKAIRHETKIRTDMATDILSAFTLSSSPYAFHMWMHLPSPYKKADFIDKLRQVHITALSSDTFAINSPIEAVRLSLGAIKHRDTLEQTLKIIRDILEETPQMSSIAV